MGQSESVARPSQDEVDILKDTTHFSHKEIEDWHTKFLHDYPDGHITKESFVAMYRHMFPDGDAQDMAEHVFQAQDANGDGYVDFVEFMSTLSVATRGSVEEKLQWAFRMYDLDGDGHVTRDEALSILTAIFKMRAEEDYESLAEAAVEELFIHLDKDQTNTLTQMEFIMAAKNSRSIVRLLKQ